VNEDTERVLAQSVDVAWGVKHDGENGGPALGHRQCTVLVAPLDPGNAERRVGGADHARNFDGDLDLADLCKGIVDAGVVVEGRRTLVRGEVVGAEPVLPNDDGIGGDRAELFDKTSEMPGDLRIGGLVVGNGRRDRLRFTELVDLYHPRHHGAASRLPDQASGQSRREKQVAEGNEAPVPGLHAGRTDAFVPRLGGLLIGRLGRECLAVSDGRAPKEIHLRSSESETEVEPPP